MTKHVNVEAKECESMGVCALNSEHEVICQSLNQVPDSQVINRVWRKTASPTKSFTKNLLSMKHVWQYLCPR